jgi:hypothetical protein
MRPHLMDDGIAPIARQGNDHRGRQKGQQVASDVLGLAVSQPNENKVRTESAKARLDIDAIAELCHESQHRRIG